MNASKASSCLAFVAMFLVGCMTTHRLSVSPGNSAAATYENGDLWLQSVEKCTVMVQLLTPVYKTAVGDQLPPAFLVSVSNGGKEPILISRGDVVAAVDGKRVQLMTYKEYCQMVNWQSAMAIAEAQRSGDVEPPSYYGASGAHPVYGSNGPNVIAGALGAPQVDHSYPFLAPASGEVRKIEQERNAMLARADLMQFLDNRVIGPGQMTGGVIRLRAYNFPEGKSLTLSFKIGDETHRFAYDTN